MRVMLSIILCLLALTSRAQYDAPGIDSAYGKPQPNAYARVKASGHNVYTQSPQRKDYFTAKGNDSIGAAVFTWSNNNSCGTVTGGKLMNPALKLMNVESAWAKGYTGAGIKVGVLDVGYSGLIPHRSIRISKSFNAGNSVDSSETLTTPHTAAVISALAGRDRDSSRIVGVAPDALVYAASYDNTEAAMKWFIKQGVDIVTASFVWSASDEAVSLIKSFTQGGGILVVASGNNNSSVAQMQAVCGIPGVVCVGSTEGGGALTISDSFHYKNVIPVNGKGIDFTLPFLTVVSYFDSQEIGGSTSGGDGLNFYSLQSGSSFQAPQVAGALAIILQRYPRLKGHGRAAYHILRRYSRSFSQTLTYGGVPTSVTAYIPNLSFIK